MRTRFAGSELLRFVYTNPYTNPVQNAREHSRTTTCRTGAELAQTSRNLAILVYNCEQ
jgi:hypothetical protein